MRRFQIHRETGEREACPGRAVCRALVGIVVAAVASACATVPYTGRRQLAIVSDAKEIGQGEQLYGTMRRSSLVSPDREAQAIVRDIGRRIAAVADQPSWNWDFTLFADDEQVNAWALPGGKVGIYTGIFPVARDEAGLATIVAHEVAHAIAHHSGERASQGTLLGVLGGGLGIAAETMSPGSGGLVQGVYGLGAQYVMLPFSRAQESEADEIGLILMAKAGYDPRAALDVWERMGEVERKQQAPPEFASTHPSYGTRIGNIREGLPAALRYYSGASRSRPLPRLEALAKLDPAELALLESVQRIDRLAASSPESPAVAYAIAYEFNTSADQVVGFANNASLTPGEAALALAIARDTRTSATSVVREAQHGRGWYEIARDANADPRALNAELERIAREAGAPVRRPAR